MHIYIYIYILQQEVNKYRCGDFAYVGIFIINELKFSDFIICNVKCNNVRLKISPFYQL